MRAIPRDIAVSVLIALLAAIVYWNSLSIPPGLYDPLGAGTMPRIICGGILVFCAISILSSLMRRTQKPKQASAPGKILAPARPWLAVGTFGLMIALAIALRFRVPFAISTSLFLFAGIMAARKFKVAAIPMSALLSIVVGFGVAYLFGSVLSVDLP